MFATLSRVFPVGPSPAVRIDTFLVGRAYCNAFNFGSDVRGESEGRASRSSGESGHLSPGQLTADRVAAMDFLYNIVVLVHLLAMAAVVGGYVYALKAPRITESMVWGARIVFLSGVAVVGIGEGALDKEYIMAKIAVKLVVALVVVGLAEVARAKQKRDEPAVNLVHAAGGLAIVNVFIAVLWT